MNWNKVPVVLDKISVIDNRNTIIDKIELNIHPGKVTVMMGPSGCGKSTVLKAAAGLIPITKGSVNYGDIKLYKLNQKDFARVQKHTGFMFQDGALWQNKSIYENLSLPLVIADPDMNKNLVEESVMNSLKSFKMERERLSRPAALSAGERKIISFLRAIISDPQIIFMDEPTTYIDRKSSLLLIQEMFRFKREGKTVVIVTHDLTLAKSIADYFVFLHEGRIVVNDTMNAAMNTDNELLMAFIEDQAIADDRKE